MRASRFRKIYEIYTAMKILTINQERTYYTCSCALKWSIWNDIIPVNDNSVVIYNTRYRNAILVTKDTLDSVPVDRRYISLGFVVEENVDESSVWNESFSKAISDMSYIDLTILLTHQCQMKCQYCFEGDKENTNISSDTQTAIIRYLKKHSEIGKRLRVTWFGGEPLLNYHALKSMSEQFIDFCSINEWHYSADITTNAYALTKERCIELVNDYQIKRFIITLDGPAEIHDKRRPLRSGHPTFARIWKNIGFLLEAGAKVTLRMTIDRENSADIPGFLHDIARSDYAGNLGLAFCRTIDYNFTPHEVKSSIYTQKEFAEVEWDLIQEAHALGLYAYSFPHAAPAGGCLREGDVVIGSDGVIYKCLDTVGDKRWAIASVDNFEDIDEYPQWYSEWRNWTPAHSKACSECVLRPLCNGGCPHNALFRDKMHGSNTQCPDWKANYRKQIIELVKEL